MKKKVDANHENAAVIFKSMSTDRFAGSCLAGRSIYVLARILIEKLVGPNQVF